eukprot:5084996-Pyramimonas_sp.AAC.1
MSDVSSLARVAARADRDPRPLDVARGAPVPVRAVQGAEAMAAAWCWLPQALPPPASAPPAWWPQP